jgi:hypothetical protein
MPLRPQSKHASAQPNSLGVHRPSGGFDVLNDPKGASRLKARAHRANQQGRADGAGRVAHGSVALTGWACPNKVSAFKRKCEGVRLNKPEWISWLRFDIDAQHFEASAM